MSMKKLLALVLALTMVLSVSAAAAYTVAPYGDAEQVDEDCEVAVQTLYSMEIMKGDDKGNFNPTATITRAEVAKMIYVILNYGDDDKAVNYTGAKIFSDVPAGEWYEGYVNYAATTKLVQGRPDGTFGPNDPITTAEAAKMLLTAIGYSAENRGYVGAGWDKQVLADASIIGLLNDYDYNTMGYAPRQWVAVMFLNALTEAYTYSTIAPVVFNGLLTGTNYGYEYITMGEKYYNMKEFSGIVTANEYADLYGDEPISSGRTVLDDNKDLKLKVSTDLTVIGESRWGYYNTKNNEVYYLGDTGDNTVYTTGDETDLSTSTKFKSATGIKKGGEYFVNFDDVTSFDGTVNGDWLRVVDNDADGTAEYVFKTTFTMSAYDYMDDDDNVHLTDATFADDTYELYADAAAEDVVLYTTIDGVTYIELAESFAGEAEKYTYKTDALTVDGEDYTQSGIAYDEDLDLWAYVADAKKDTEYTYYQDFFGHIRLFGVDVADSGDLVLLTDAYYETNRSGSIAAVDAYLDGEIKDTDVRNSATYTDIEMFINTRTADNNAWGRLVEFENGTHIARYTMSDEGVMSLYDAETWRYNTQGTAVELKTQYIDLNETDAEAGQTAYYGYVADVTAAGVANEQTEVKVQANRDTVFYYVSWTTGSPVIKTVTGYKNSCDVVDDVVDIKAIYAVATDVSEDAAEADYWVADVIVIETELPVFNLLTNDIVLGYDIANRAVSDYAYMDVVKADAAIDGLNVISHNGDDFDTFVKNGDLTVLNFFFNTVDENGDSYLVDLTDYKTNEIYVGTVDRANKLYEYVTLVDGTIDELVYTENTVVYDIDAKTRYNAISTVSAGLVTGKDYIFFAPDEEVVYAILVEDADDVAYDLFERIGDPASVALKAAIAEAQAAYDKLIDATVEANAETASAWPAGAAEAAKAAVAKALAAMTAEEIAALAPAKGDAIWTNVIVPVVVELQNAAADAETAEGYKAIAAGKAAAYMEQIKAELANAIAWTSGSTVKGLVEAKIATITPDGNTAEYTATVVTAGDLSLEGEHGTKTVAVDVSVTNSYAGVVCDPVVATIDITISW